jgi:hypothetical protein
MPSTRTIRYAVSVGLMASLLVGGCGLPQGPDIRVEMTQHLTKLGVRPFYPLRESPRVGEIYVVDAATADPRSGFQAYHQTGEWVSDALVADLESRRRESQAMRQRFPRSPDNLATQLRPATNGHALFRQPGADQANAVAPGSLALAAYPGLTLASVDEFSAGGFVPQAFTSLLAALALRSTRYVRVEAEGVEVADVPLESIVAGLARACGDRRTPLGNSARGQGLVAFAHDIMHVRYLERLAGARGAERTAREQAGFKPQIYVLRRVIYLRGIRYIIDDSQTSAAMLRAAFSAPVRPDITPPSINQVSVTNTPPAGAGNTSVGNVAESEARITAIRRELDELRTKLGTGNDAQLAASFARATARGIELVDLFDRPMAFGYETLSWNIDNTLVGGVPRTTQGFEKLCREPGVTGP